MEIFKGVLRKSEMCCTGPADAANDGRAREFREGAIGAPILEKVNKEAGHAD